MFFKKAAREEERKFLCRIFEEKEEEKKKKKIQKHTNRSLSSFFSRPFLLQKNIYREKHTLYAQKDKITLCAIK